MKEFALYLPYILPVLSFFFGAVPYAYLISRFFYGVNILEHGSGNPGASNLYRVVAKVPGIIVFFLDTLKGAVPVYIASLVVDGNYTVYYQTLIGFCAAAGHIWTPYLNFHGGKGVATFLGTFLVIFPGGILVSIGVGCVVILISRIFSLGSLSGAGILPVTYFVFYWKDPWNSGTLPILFFCVATCILIFYRHRDNLQRLKQGKEFKTQLKSQEK